MRQLCSTAGVPIPIGGSRIARSNSAFCPMISLKFLPLLWKKTGLIDRSSTEQFHSGKTREHFQRYPVVVNRHFEGFTWLPVIGNAWKCWHYLISNKTRIWLICTWRQHKSGRCLQAINSWFSEKALKTLSMRTERSTLIMIMQCLRTVFGKRIHSTSGVWREGVRGLVCVSWTSHSRHISSGYHCFWFQL